MSRVELLTILVCLPNVLDRATLRLDMAPKLWRWIDANPAKWSRLKTMRAEHFLQWVIDNYEGGRIVLVRPGSRR